jgi:ABC-type transporter Mla subunit MlaD
MKTLRTLQSFILLVIVTPLLFFGCSDNSLTFLLRFPEVSGLKQNDQVYFGQNDIGEVNKVTYTTAGDYLVEVKIAPDFRNAATVDSKFYIEPFGTQQVMAVIVEQGRPGGAILNNGATIAGSKRAGYLDTIFKSIKEKADEATIELTRNLEELQKSLEESSTKLDSSLGAATDDLAKQFNSFRNDIENLPDSQEVKQLEESIKKFTEEFQKAQKNVQDHIREKILPQLQQELEILRKQLDEAGRKQEMQEIDNEAKKLESV